MDLNSVRSLFTVWIFISFVLVVYVAWNRRNKNTYEDVAKSIIDDPDTPDTPAESNHNNGAK